MGEKNFLVDCAVSAKAKEIYQKTQKILKSKPSIKTKRIDSMLLTHSHYDHVGACPYLQNIYNFNIYASQRTVELLKKPKVVEKIKKLNLDFEKLSNSKTETEFFMFENLTGVFEGDRIKAGEDRYFEIYETPGHTKCSISFLLLPDKILFPGDSSGLLDKDRNIKSFFFSSYKEYERSLKKLLKINAEVLALPHNRHIKGKERVEEYLKNSLRAAQKSKNKILDNLRQTEDFEKIAEDMIKKEFPLQTLVQTLIGSSNALKKNYSAMVKSVYNEFVT